MVEFGPKIEVLREGADETEWVPAGEVRLHGQALTIERLVMFIWDSV